MIIKIIAGFKPGINRLFRTYCKINYIFLKKDTAYNKIPVIINNYNRLDFLLRLIEWLEKAGMTNIYIIDNKSDYKPLLEYYKKTKYVVFKLDENIGQFALWETHIFMLFKNRKYVYTDPDILPIESCPLNAVEYFNKTLSKYSGYEKVGFGLKIDDLPAFYPLKEKVINWEQQFWENEIEENLYEALIDTTFALYTANSKGGADIKAIRTGGNYIARHLPWYIDYDNLSEEETHYMNTASKASSWIQQVKGINQ